jgi:murein L,D-transpeptidase YafK
MMIAWWMLIALQTPADRCTGRGVDVVVDTQTATLLLCDNGTTAQRYAVNLGGGGTGKRQQGDRKTPLGRYPLQAPRASASGFTWFVPIGYPTSPQQAAGFTGGAIGIHGPPDWMEQAIIDVAFATPWTDGCIMVRTTAEIEAVRAWLLVHKPKAIELL